MLNRRNVFLAAGMVAAVCLTAGALIASTASASPGPVTGASAPAFTGTDANGNAVSLADFAGKTVVLEWTNDGCPFVQKHYGAPARNMQGLQAAAKADGTIWISVISSAPRKQGHVDGAGANALSADRGASPAHVILDADGTIGRLYGAKTTPHMFVINAAGDIVYQGAIDSVASAKPADISGATNYVTAALASVKAGTAVAAASTKPYGCSVKY
jgi:AhpC/TSA family